ncbi:hypothetical protein PENSPDRAFT_302908 [Peniophora sp. CONT]|nr:hypothetical protein PENSPDRAFT_302908 [Peniophora sp. CONT]
MTLAATKASSRHRVRITNKTRLRVTRQPLDDLQESRDDEVVRADVSTAGVDVEDAKEHHLQAVLSAAQKQQAQVPGAESSVKSALPVPELVIPIPDHAGTVDSYEQHYPVERWTDPHSYVKVSSVVEECVEAGLNGGFTYYMDEQDQEWLDAQNKLASTLPLTPVSAAPRASRRGSMRESAEPPRAFPASYDEFELVMGVLELVTEQKAPLLHHDQAYPPFSDYLNVFANELPPDIFSSFKVPIWVPPPARMTSLASAIYPYWKERRNCRKGLRIIPALNYDESDVKNESYVCFRRREVKAVRKTRHSTANTIATDRLQRLKGELATCAEMAHALSRRETLKLEQNRANQVVFNARKNFADLLRANPSLAEAKDNDLFFDKDPTPRKKAKLQVATEDDAGPRRPGRPSKASRNAAVPPTPVSATRPDKVPSVMHPQERYRLAKTLEDELEKDARDSDMDDAFDDDSFRSTYRPTPDRAFHTVLKPLNAELPGSERDEDSFHYRAVRTRRGRGGLRRVDRRASPHRYHQSREDDNLFKLPRRSSSADAADGENAMDEDPEALRRRRQQWLFDSDEPVDGEARVLVDDHKSKYLVRTMSLVTDADRRKLYDFNVSFTDAEGNTHKLPPVVDPMSDDISMKQRATEAYLRARRREQMQEAQRRAHAHAQAQAQAQANAKQTSSSPERNAKDSASMDVDVAVPASTSAPPALPTPPSISTPRLPSSLFAERSSTPNSVMSAAHAHGRTAMQAFHSRGAIHMPCVPSSSSSPLDVGGQGGRFGAAYITAKPGPLPSPPATATPSDASS